MKKKQPSPFIQRGTFNSSGGEQTRIPITAQISAKNEFSIKKQNKSRLSGRRSSAMDASLNEGVPEYLQNIK